MPPRSTIGMPASPKSATCPTRGPASSTSAAGSRTSSITTNGSASTSARHSSPGWRRRHRNCSMRFGPPTRRASRAWGTATPSPRRTITSSCRWHLRATGRHRSAGRCTNSGTDSTAFRTPCGWRKPPSTRPRSVSWWTPGCNISSCRPPRQPAGGPSGTPPGAPPPRRRSIPVGRTGGSIGIPGDRHRGIAESTSVFTTPRCHGGSASSTTCGTPDCWRRGSSRLPARRPIR